MFFAHDIFLTALFGNCRIVLDDAHQSKHAHLQVALRLGLRVSRIVSPDL